MQGFVSVETYLTLECPGGTWVIEDLLPVGGYLNIYGEPKAGKAQALTTPVLTPAGWSTIGDIQPGDFVYGTDGRPTLVYAVSPIFRDHVCYDVTFDDGEVIRCDAQHEWTVFSRSERWDCTRTTQALLDAGVTTLEGRYRRAHWRVRLPNAVMFPPLPSPLPITPYTLGAWLGDGDARWGGLTSADPEVIDQIRSEGWEVRKLQGKYHYGIQGLRSCLKALNLYRNKHIPDVYLRASIPERQALLAGLMDTDGGVEKGTALFYNTNKRLVLQVKELAEQLGYRVRMGEKRSTLYGKDCGLTYQLRIRAHEPLFRLTRKRAKQQVNTELYRSIVAIDPAPTVPVKCLVVEAPDHLFLTGKSCTPTHNSMIAAEFASAVANPLVDEMLGFPIRKHGVVAYFQLDTPRAIWQMRFRNLARKGYSFQDVYMCDKHLTGSKAFDIQLDGVKWLHEALCELPQFPILVVIDTLRKAHNGDENSSSVMKDVCGKIEEAARPAAIILISHAKKRQGMEEESSLNNDSRGSSYVPGEMDANMKVDHGQFLFSSRTATEARYQTHKNAVDGEVTLIDPIFEEARTLIRNSPDPDGDLLELGELLHKRLLRREKPRRVDVDVCVGTLSRMRSIEVGLRRLRENPNPEQTPGCQHT